MTTKISMLAIDLAKNSFQVCAVGPDGAVLYNRVLSRARMVRLLRLGPAAYVKPFVKHQRNDRADAEAIAEAASRPTMRFVAVKSVETQGRAVGFRTH